MPIAGIDITYIFIVEKNAYTIFKPLFGGTPAQVWGSDCHSQTRI